MSQCVSSHSNHLSTRTWNPKMLDIDPRFGVKMFLCNSNYVKWHRLATGTGVERGEDNNRVGYPTKIVPFSLSSWLQSSDKGFSIFFLTAFFNCRAGCSTLPLNSANESMWQASQMDSTIQNCFSTLTTGAKNEWNLWWGKTWESLDNVWSLSHK